MQLNAIGKKFILCFLILACAGMFSSCSNSRSVQLQPGSSGQLAQVNTVVESYGDIELPLDMVLDKKQSMAMKTDSFQGGIHVYKGRIQMPSLRDYIIASMRNNKWKLVGEASTKDIMLAFIKPNRTCMVVLTEEGVSALGGKTKASFYVTVDLASGGHLNPFGEPVNH